MSITYSPGSCSVIKTVTINPLREPVSGNSGICFGSVATLSDATPFGIWKTADSCVVTIDSTGNVKSIFPGSDTITYTPKLGCAANFILTIKPPLPIDNRSQLCIYRSEAPFDITEMLPTGFYLIHLSDGDHMNFVQKMVRE